MLGHREIIVDQFTKQAQLFANAPEMKNEEALQHLVKATSAGPEDTVLDVACGPGLVACAFAQVVRHAEGIDLTPAMIEQARALEAEKRLTNVRWKIGDVLPLPYMDRSFSIVVSRYAFHHLRNPRSVLAEMTRVCTPLGNVAVVDVIASQEILKAAAFNQMERWRDPSHVRALSIEEFERFFCDVGLPAPRAIFYRLEFELERLLQGSFPNDGDAAKVREKFRDSLDADLMGVHPELRGEEIWFAYPMAILTAQKPASWRMPKF
jgi:SAM-dependent methyltransferase